MSTARNYQTEPTNGEAAEFPAGLLYVDAVRSMRRHKLLAISGLLMGIAAGYLLCRYWPPMFESEAQLLVVKKRPVEAPGGAAGGQPVEFADYLSAHEALIRSPLIAEKAVQRAGLAKLKSLADVDDPAKSIVANLSVEAGSQQQGAHTVLVLAYRNPQPEDARVVLDAIVSSYRTHLEDMYRSSAREVGNLLGRWRTEVGETLAEKQRAYQRLRDETPKNLWTGKDGVNLSQRRLTDLEALRLSQSVRKTELEERIATLNEAIARGLGQEELVQIVARWAQPHTSPRRQTDALEKINSVLRERLVSLRIEAESLPESFGPRHPQAMALREQIKATENMLFGQSEWNIPEEAVDEAEEVAPVGDPVQAYLESLRQDLHVATALEQSLETLVADEQQRAREINDRNEDMAMLLADIARVQEIHREVVNQLQSVDFAAQSTGYLAQLISPPETGEQVIPQPLFIYPVAACLGILLGLGLAHLAELSVQRFHNPEEIRRDVGLPVVAHVPYCRASRGEIRRAGEGAARLAPTLCAFFRSESKEAEAIRALRTALLFGRDRRPNNVVQIVSASRGDGKTTLSANLAVSITGAGKRVILIDMDLRRPNVHRMFGLSREVGLISVLRGEASLVDAIQETPMAGLAVITAGPRHAGASDLLSTTRFRELIESLQDQYDFVIVDTAPISATSDACVIARYAGAVFLVLPNRKGARIATKHTVQTLKDYGARLVGIVVNGLKRGSRAYGYTDRYGVPDYAATYAPPDVEDAPALTPAASAKESSAS